jgi:predicted NAD/FAD-binding protein
MREMGADRRRIAVIGAGVSGLTAAYLLQRRADVTLYEADDRLGGHAHTHDVDAESQMFAVDSGFIVHNRRTYPNLLRLFAELGVRTQETEMSMSVRCLGCGLEYAGAKGARGMFAQPSAVARPAYLAMLAQVPRFHRQARALLSAGTDDCTLGEFVRRGRYTRYFNQHFVVPLVSAVWSCGPELVANYPARYLLTFLAHHGMLTVKGSPVWRTVTGGSRQYVDAAAKELSAVRTATPVRAVLRVGKGVAVRDDADSLAEYDAVVLATHADQALRLLADPDRAQQEVLGSFTYSSNETVLHRDDQVLPQRIGARASWNYLLASCQPATGTPVQVSYDMNRLQRLGTTSPLLVTLNGAQRVRPESVIARMVYKHPVYTPTVLAAQKRLPELNNGVMAFAGAYHGWGFHEDGCRAGATAAASLGVPW